MELSEILAGIKRIEDRMLDLVKSQAEHNAILSEHKNFSLALQKEQEKIQTDLEPIKSHVYLVTTLLKLAGGVAIGALTQYVYHKFL